MNTMRPLSVSKVAKVADLDDWTLVVIFNHYGHTPLNVTRGLQNRIMDVTWTLQDGYGAPGVIPAQGWDWSGIRDSSDAAKAEIASTIRAMLAAAHINTLEYRKDTL